MKLFEGYDDGPIGYENVVLQPWDGSLFDTRNCEDMYCTLAEAGLKVLTHKLTHITHEEVEALTQRHGLGNSMQRLDVLRDLAKLGGVTDYTINYALSTTRLPNNERVILLSNLKEADVIRRIRVLFDDEADEVAAGWLEEGLEGIERVSVGSLLLTLTCTEA